MFHNRICPSCHGPKTGTNLIYCTPCAQAKGKTYRAAHHRKLRHYFRNYYWRKKLEALDPGIPKV
jgi:hypothetical protein